MEYGKNCRDIYSVKLDRKCTTTIDKSANVHHIGLRETAGNCVVYLLTKLNALCNYTNLSAVSNLVKLNNAQSTYKITDISRGHCCPNA